MSEQATAYQPDCRMLNASNSAYTIVPGHGWSPPGASDPSFRFYEAVGYGSTPIAIQGGPDHIDACLVGENQDGVIVAFRGTLGLGDPPTSPELLDWLQDLLAPPQTVPLEGWAQDILVHTGFWEALESLWGPLKQQLAEMGVSSKDLYFTGHSKGGPVASLAAYRYFIEEKKSSKTYTFASPHPGNRNFAAAFKAAGLHQTRWENYLDVVPLLPPDETLAEFLKIYVDSESGIPAFLKSFILAVLNLAEKKWQYGPVGSGWFIDSSGKRHDLGFIEEGLQLLDLKSAIKNQEYGRIAAAHCHSCYAEAGGKVTCAGGYMDGVCRGTVCPPRTP